MQHKWTFEGDSAFHRADSIVCSCGWSFPSYGKLTDAELVAEWQVHAWTARQAQAVADFFHMDADDFLKTIREATLDAAKKCVCGDRDKQYGIPENNFKTIAALWTAYVASSHGLDVSPVFDPADVAAMMALLKIARISTGKDKADSWIDGCGYLACGAEVAGAK